MNGCLYHSLGVLSLLYQVVGLTLPLARGKDASYTEDWRKRKLSAGNCETKLQQYNIEAAFQAIAPQRRLSFYMLLELDPPPPPSLCLPIQTRPLPYSQREERKKPGNRATLSERHITKLCIGKNYGNSDSRKNRASTAGLFIKIYVSERVN